MTAGELSLIIFLGSAWGFFEATLGFAIHLLRRVLPVPGLTGYVLFPIGFFLMYSAVTRTGRARAAVEVALVAAAVKLSSGLLPSVSWLFVTNPALSILAEGFATAAGLSLFRMTRSLRSVPKALAVSAGWRLLFLLAVFILPVQKGILLKGSAALATFLIADSTVNAVLIGVPYWARMPPILPKTWEIRFPSKLWAAGALAAAIGTRIVFSSVP